MLKKAMRLLPVFAVMAAIALAALLGGQDVSRAQASQDQQVAVVSAAIPWGFPIDHGGGPGTRAQNTIVSVVLTGSPLASEGSAIVPEYHLIGPIAGQAANRANIRFTVDETLNSALHAASITTTIAGPSTRARSFQAAACSQAKNGAQLSTLRIDRANTSNLTGPIATAVKGSKGTFLGSY